MKSKAGTAPRRARTRTGSDAPGDTSARVDDLERQLKEAHEQQAATSEILRVISSSPTDLQPVFDTIVGNATRLCDASRGALHLYENETYTQVAEQGASAAFAEFRKKKLRPGPLTGLGQLAAEKRVIHIEDLAETPGYANRDPFVVASVELGGTRTYLAVPMLKDGLLIGAVSIRRQEVRPFTDKQIALLQTFAAQAVIAIENVRLFKELQARNAEIIESLEQQTATSEILRVISSSPTDTQPVFDAVAESAARLCGAHDVVIRLVEGNVYRGVAHFGPIPFNPPRVLGRGFIAGRAVLDGRTLHIPDVTAAHVREEYPETTTVVDGHRTFLAVPLMREDTAIGVIIMRRLEVRPFTDKQIKLLEMFAAQAVIAIENVRLFKELQASNAEITESLGQQTATAEILRIISRSPTDTQPVFDAIVTSGVRLFGGLDVALRLVRDNKIVLIAATRPDWSSTGGVPLDDSGPGPAGRAVLRREIVLIPDTRQEDSAPERVRQNWERRGIRAVLVAPLLQAEKAVGAIAVSRATPGSFSDKEIALLKTFADQAVIAIENVRLFKEIQQKSGELEIANRHKSEFLAGMSHELRTPLNAILGFSEVLQERMFGELNDKQAEYLHDIHSSGAHLLSLINDILDLSKIEAGRMDLELSEFDIAAALENALTLVRERATRHGISLDLSCESGIGPWTADERKFKQIMLNLLSNAVKFTPASGRITVEAQLEGDTLDIAVSDTGCGISPADQALVFEEFRQAGGDSGKKAEGTGLGLALTRKFVELHGGSIEVRSELGRGATFRFTLPQGLSRKV